MVTSTARQLCPGCLDPIEIGDECTWVIVSGLPEARHPGCVPDAPEEPPDKP